MKNIILLLILISLLFSCTKDCTQWYSRIKLSPITLTNNGNAQIGEWYVTDFLVNELNLAVTFTYSADGYEGCKSKTMIHSVQKDSVFISCDNYMIIESDTIPKHSNLLEYFNLTENEGHFLYNFNKDEYGFPEFESETNTFLINFVFSDNEILKDSCIVKITNR